MVSTVFEQEYCKEYDNYSKLLELHNQTLLRVISVTDFALRETLQDEYVIICEKLATSESKYKSMEPEYIKLLSADLLKEFTEFYERQFVSDSLQNILNNQGVDLLVLANKLRMRPITNLEQKRELCILLNDLHRQLKIVDYQGMQIDIIGKYKDPNPLIVRCRGFSTLSPNILNTIRSKSF